MTKSGIPHGKARTRFLGWGLLTPLAVLLLLTLIPLIWLEQLPDQVPVHWGPSGQADQFQSPGGAIASVAGLGTVIIVLMWAVGLALGKDMMTRRIMAGANSFLAMVLGGLLFGTLWHFRTGPAGDLKIDFLIIVVLVLGTALGFGVGALIRREPTVLATGLPSPDSPRTALTDSELGVWVTRTDSRTGYIIAGINIVVFVAIIISTQLWWLILFALLLSLVMITMFAWNVRVDQTGLSVTSVARVPKRHIHLDEIENAEVSTVNAMSDFGGWGLRTGFSGSTGVILRSGPALQINMSGNRTFYVTVDDADTGAALLNSLVDRTRPATDS